MKNKLLFRCKNCGPGIPVYVELWEENSDSMYGMYFLNQENGYAEIIDEIIMHNPTKKGKVIHIHYCGYCDKNLKRPLTVEHHQLIHEYVESILIKKGSLN